MGGELTMTTKKVDINEFLDKQKEVKKWEDNYLKKSGKRRLPNYVIFKDGYQAKISDWIDAVKRYTAFMQTKGYVPKYVNVAVYKPEVNSKPSLILTEPVKCYYSDQPPMWHFGHDWYAGKIHVGKDVCRNQNAEVVSIADGTVKQSYDSTTWAGVIVVEYNYEGHRFTAVYWHINRSRKVGDKVKRGEKIGTIYRGLRAKSGQSDVNDHLHFGVRIGKYDSTYSQKGALYKTNIHGFVDPDKFLKNPLTYLK